MKTISRTGFYPVLLLVIAVSLSFFLSYCESTGPSFDPIEITGQVLDEDTEEPVGNAIVRMVQPTPEKSTVTDSDGRFFFEADVDSTMDVQILITKEGYQTLTLETVAIPERNIEFPVARLSVIRDETDPPIDDDDDPDVEAGEPASVVLSSVSAETITVKETGGIEQSDFVFQVADSAGRPVSGAEVEFRLGSSPDGGETINPATATTDEDGQALTTLTSGTVSGVVQVIARVQTDEVTAESRPVSVSIQSGLPSNNHFTLYRPNPLNVPIDGTSQISVMLGDRYGNPVAAGTRVYFTTDHGVIGASSATNDEGLAEVTLRRGQPSPPDGFVTVTARTVDENSQSVERQATVLFNVPPILIEVNPTDFDIALLSDQTFNYTVTDANNNPLPEGSTIEVEVEGEDVEVIGDVSVTLDDHLAGGQGITEFSFNVAGVNEELHENPRPVFITITAQTSTDTQTVQIQGRKAKEVMN
ncbi:MAG: Ig-like domain-containing protein [Cyclonatronaceae bacterium]